MNKNFKFIYDDSHASYTITVMGLMIALNCDSKNIVLFTFSTAKYKTIHDLIQIHYKHDQI